MTNVERLTQLRRVVEAAPSHLFVMNDFETTVPGCGTAYCAYGWAEQDQWFIKNGLPTDFSDLERPELFQALADYFRIGRRDADRLFGAGFTMDGEGGFMTDKAPVLANIDRLIAFEDAELYDGCEENEYNYDDGDRLIEDYVDDEDY
jgi:hypothetical protein